MSPETQIAVIIPCYNHSDVLRRTLEALKKQTLKPTEICLVDDGSSDHPDKILHQVFSGRTLQQVPGQKGNIGDLVVDVRHEARVGNQEKPHLMYIRLAQNSGAPIARNLGAIYTHAPYVIFLDADAELVPQALETYVQSLEDHPEAEYAYANFRWGRRLFRSRTYDPDMLKQANYIHTSALIRRAAFPGFDPSLKKFQDWDLWLTMAKQGKPGIWVEQELYRIEPRRRGTGLSTWLPSFLHRLPWPIFGWMPREIRKYRQAEEVIRKKHQI